MAEVTGLRNNALPYPVYGVPFGVIFPILDNDGDLVTGASDLDSERSLNGDTYADCTNEATEIATNSGTYYLLLTAAEMTADAVSIIVKTSTSDAKTTMLTLYPRKLPILSTGTAQGSNDTGDIQLASGEPAVDDFYNGCLCVAVIDSVTEARIINDYVGSTKVGEVSPAWSTAQPDSNDTYTIYLPEGRQVMSADVKAWLATTVATPGTAGVPSVDAIRISTSSTAADNLETAALNYSATRGLAGTALPAAAADAAGGLPISDAGGLDLDAKIGALTFTVANVLDANTLRVGGTTQTARDIGASVLLSNGTGTGQLKLASGYVAMTWADIAASTTTVNLSGTTIKTATDVEADTADLQSRTPAALGANGNMKADLRDSLGVAITNDDFTIASATASTITLPTTYSSGASLPDDDRYQHCSLSVVGGTGAGQMVAITTAAAGARTYNVNTDTMVVQLDNTSKCVVVDTTRANATATVDLASFFDTDSGETYASAVAGSVVKEIADNAGGSALTEAGIADAVWDEVASGHTTNGTYGKAFTGATNVFLASGIAGTINTLDALDTAQDSQHSTTQGLVTTVDGVVDTILVDTNELQTDWANGGRLDLIIDATLADTNELQTDWANGGRLDLIIDATATAAELAKVPKSDSNVTWNATALASIQSEANDALVANHLDHLYSASASVNDASATTTSFNTTLTQADTFWDDAQITFTSGALAGQSKLITAYANANGNITLDEPLSSAPANGVTFVIKAVHAHSKSQITSDVWNNGARTLTAGTNIQLPANGLANVTAWTVAITGNITGNLSGSVGSVTGNVGGNVAGSVASVTAGVTLANGAITTASMVDGAITDAKITVPTVSGVATGVLGMLVQLWRRFFKKSTLTTTELKTYADNGSTVLTTQTVSDDLTTQTQGPAT